MQFSYKDTCSFISMFTINNTIVHLNKVLCELLMIYKQHRITSLTSLFTIFTQFRIRFLATDIVSDIQNMYVNICMI